MKRRTAICLLSSLIAITAASTSISVAWYSTSAFLQITDINVTLSSGSPLLISTKIDGDYKSALEYKDLKKVEAFEPVTSILQDEWMDREDDYPTFYETYNNRATTIVTSGGTTYAQPYDNKAKEGFLSQELFLYSDYEYMVTIDTTQTVFKANKQANWKKAEELAKNRGEKTVEEYYHDLNKLVDSIRFSILVTTPTKYDYKVFDPNKNQETTYLGGLLDTATMGHYDAAGFGDSRCETLYGEVNDRSKIIYYDEPQPEEIIGKHTWFNSAHDPTAKQVNFEASYLNGLEIKEEEAMSLSEYQVIKDKVINRTATPEEKASLLMIPVKTGVPSRIVFSIYFEGFDIDNINDTMAASFTSNVVFDVISAGAI